MTQLSALASWHVHVWRTMVTGSPSYATRSVTLTVVVSTRRQETFTDVNSQTFISFFKQPAAARPKRRPPPFRAGGRRLFEKWDKRLTAHTCESFLSPSWDYYSQCHWPRCVRRWAGNHSASDVNGSGVQSTQLGHGEALTFWILFLNPSSSFFV